MSIISRKARYAMHGLAYVAVSSGGGPVPFNRILGYLRVYSQHLTLSPSYIAKIFQELSRAGFTVAIPGPHGGYQLSRAAEKIPLTEVLEALDGPLRTECCLLSVGECTRQSTCGVRSVIHEAELTFYRFLQSESIGSLADKMDFPEEDVILAAMASGETPPRHPGKGQKSA
jgi:Rrf2 family protein